MAQDAALGASEIANPQVSAVRPIDLVHLAKQCLGDEGLEHEILRLFSTTIATYYGRLERARDGDALAVNLHAIKGASAGVGAWGVADLAMSMERDLRAGQPLSSERIADLGLAVAEVRGFIAAMLADVQV